jgi:hypothetical protein
MEMKIMKAVTAVTVDNQETISDYWKRQIETCEKNDTSKARFCREHQLNYSQMMYWQKKLEKNNPELMKKQNAFVPIKISSDARVLDNACLCTLTLPSGHVLKIHDEKAFSLLLEKWR